MTMSSKMKAGKRKVSQNDLRKMMQQMKSKRSKVDAPETSVKTNSHVLKRSNSPATYIPNKQLKHSDTASSFKKKSSVLLPSNGAVRAKLNGINKSVTNTDKPSVKQFKKVQPVKLKAKINPLLADYGSSSEDSDDDQVFQNSGCRRPEAGACARVS